MKDNKPQTVTVETGLSGDTDTEIISGINEGDTVVTATIMPQTTANPRAATTTSPFSGLGGAGALRTGGGNATFRRGN